MAGKGFAQNINFQFRDSAALVNTFIDIPLKTTTTLTGRGIVSYSLQFSVNASYLQFQGVVTTGALAAGLGTPTVNTAVPGTIKIAAAGTSPLSGLGTFLFLRFKILQAGGTNITATGGVDQNYFNEGDPVMVFFKIAVYSMGSHFPIFPLVQILPSCSRAKPSSLPLLVALHLIPGAQPIQQCQVFLPPVC